MKIAYVTTYDASDPSSWSGSGHYIARALDQQGIQISYIGSLYDRFAWFYKTKKLIYQLMGKNYLRDREPSILKSYAEQVQAGLIGLDFEAVFSPGTRPVCFLETQKPVVFWTDATFAGMQDFYPDFSNLCTQSIRDGNAMEQAALSRCQLAIYTSEWSKRTAMDHYDVNPGKLKVIPFGANLEQDISMQEVQSFIDSRPMDRCRLLFVGLDWQRKGGDVAVEVARQLKVQGLQTELSILGCVPPYQAPEFVKVYGYVSKSRPEGAELVGRLYAQSHFLILPSKADCVPQVLSEACAFGLPSIAARVGGIPEVIKDFKNGITLPPEARAQDYCAYIGALMSDSYRYRKMAQEAYYEYETRLNWRVAGAAVTDLLNSLL